MSPRQKKTCKLKHRKMSEIKTGQHRTKPDLVKGDF